jgi:hypothetical protein
MKLLEQQAGERVQLELPGQAQAGLLAVRQQGLDCELQCISPDPSW